MYDKGGRLKRSNAGMEQKECSDFFLIFVVRKRFSDVCSYCFAVLKSMLYHVCLMSLFEYFSRVPKSVSPMLLS